MTLPSPLAVPPIVAVLGADQVHPVDPIAQRLQAGEVGPDVVAARRSSGSVADSAVPAAAAAESSAVIKARSGMAVIRSPGRRSGRCPRSGCPAPPGP